MMNIATLALPSTFPVGLRNVAAGKLGRALPRLLLKLVVVEAERGISEATRRLQPDKRQ